jgi:uncharacterized membrane protein
MALDEGNVSALPALRGESDTTSFDAAMVHLYRGEMNRMTVWRQRLDVTANWAILLTFALTTFTLGSPQVPHYILLLGLALIGIAILIEGRRYRHLHHSKWRLFLLECGYFAELLRPLPDHAPRDWREELARDLTQPRFRITWLTATRARLRRNYLLLFYFVTVVWFTKLFIHPASPSTPQEFYLRLSVGDLVPHWLVAGTALLFVAAATVLALTCPSNDELEDWGSLYCAGRTAGHASVQPPE